MASYTYLFSAEDENGVPFVFRGDGAYLARPGDMVEYGGDFFKIRKVTHCAVGGDEFEMINDITQIRPADKIYSPCWEKKEAEDESA